MNYNIERLLSSNEIWVKFQDDWRAQCNLHNEDFDEYASGTFAVVKDIIDTEEKKSGVFAFQSDNVFVSMCQLNVARIPGYTSPVLRVRHMTICPEFDFGEKTIDEYAQVLVVTLAGIMVLSNSSQGFSAKHVKIHLRSPADRQFFTLLGKGMNEKDEFESVHTKGSWLYITKS